MGILLQIIVFFLTICFKVLLVGVRIGFKIIVWVWDLFGRARYVVPIFVYGTAFFLIVEILAVGFLCIGGDDTFINLLCCGQYSKYETVVAESVERSHERTRSEAVIQERKIEENSNTESSFNPILILLVIFLNLLLVVPIYVIFILIALLFLPCSYALILQIILFLPCLPLMRKMEKKRVLEEQKADNLRFLEQMIRESNGRPFPTNVMPDGSISSGTRMVYPSGYRVGTQPSYSTDEVTETDYSPRRLREISTNYQNMIQRMRAENMQYLQTAYKLQQKVGSKVRLVKAIQRCEEAINDLNEVIDECQNIIWYSDDGDKVNAAYSELKSEIYKVKYADADLLSLMKTYCNAQ